MDWDALALSTMASVGIVQGLYKKFLEENNQNTELALKLTEITWRGLMSSVRVNSQNDGLDNL